MSRRHRVNPPIQRVFEVLDSQAGIGRSHPVESNPQTSGMVGGALTLYDVDGAKLGSFTRA